MFLVLLWNCFSNCVKRVKHNLSVCKPPRALKIAFRWLVGTLFCSDILENLCSTLVDVFRHRLLYSIVAEELFCIGPELILDKIFAEPVGIVMSNAHAVVV